MIKFYDTCSLLNLQEEVFKENFVISSITIAEIENIKTSYNKDDEIKTKAKKISELLNNNEDKFEVFIYNSSLDRELEDRLILINNDARIVLSAYTYSMENSQSIVFITDDFNCKLLAKQIFNIQVESSHTIEKEEYYGYKELIMAEEDTADFYIAYADNENKYNLFENQYVILKTPDGKVLDKYKWKDGKYEALQFLKPESKMFGKISPKDVYQQLALDSLYSNQITMLRGKPGSGKSLLSFGYMFSLLEHGNINKIIVFCNTVATKGSAKLGFYPGSRTEKLLDSQIGNLLISKIGDRTYVERLIDDGKIELLPFSDIRGYDTTGMNAAIYISEAQNLDKELMKLALQRIGDDCICIIDGDDKAQVDMAMYAGANNGMRRVSEIFKGANFYGEVTLQKIYRSKIAELAQNL